MLTNRLDAGLALSERGFAVTGKLDSVHRPSRGEIVDRGLPRLWGLREPVDQNQRSVLDFSHMDLTNETFAPLRVMIDEFVRLGVEHAVIAPGSRNAPIAYALSDREELKTWSVLDERSAGFFALGIAKSSRRPVVVTCTSGSAAANLHPAVVEASHAGIPLIVLTADRPPELRDVGAGQAIDQINLFGSSARWFVEAGNHLLDESTLRHFRALSCRAVFEATGADPGPVHINL